MPTQKPRISFAIDNELKQALEIQASKESRTVSNLMRMKIFRSKNPCLKSFLGKAFKYLNPCQRLVCLALAIAFLLSSIIPMRIAIATSYPALQML